MFRRFLIETELNDFVKSVFLHPADSTNLLVLADWLEERGDDLSTQIRNIVNANTRATWGEAGNQFFIWTRNKDFGGYKLGAGVLTNDREAYIVENGRLYRQSEEEMTYPTMSHPVNIGRIKNDGLLRGIIALFLQNLVGDPTP